MEWRRRKNFFFSVWMHGGRRSKSVDELLTIFSSDLLPYVCLEAIRPFWATYVCPLFFSLERRYSLILYGLIAYTTTILIGYQQLRLRCSLPLLHLPNLKLKLQNRKYYYIMLKCLVLLCRRRPPPPQLLKVSRDIFFETKNIEIEMMTSKINRSFHAKKGIHLALLLE